MGYKSLDPNDSLLNTLALIKQQVIHIYLVQQSQRWVFLKIVKLTEVGQTDFAYCLNVLKSCYASFRFISVRFYYNYE